MSERRVHLWPTQDATVPGVPPVEYTVTAAVADVLTAYQPPAFLRSKPEWDTTPAEDREVALLERFLAEQLDAPAAEEPAPPAEPEP